MILTAWVPLGGFPDFEGKALAEHTECGFELVEPGGVEQVEQAVHLGEMAVQAACEFGFAYAIGAHGGIQRRFRFRQGRQDYGLTPQLHRRRFGNVAAILNVPAQGASECVHGFDERFVGIADRRRRDARNPALVEAPFHCQRGVG